MTLLKRHSRSQKIKTFHLVKEKNLFRCVKQDPEYIILDNPLDHLDKNLEKQLQLPYSN
jgi:ABC-type enterochelin transport system ATPase subunit